MSNERHISRRTAAKGAAWSVPVIAIGAAAPALAASGGPADLVLSQIGFGHNAATEGYDEAEAGVAYAGPYDGQDHEATDLVFVFTLPKSAFTGGPAVQGTGSQNYDWTSTVADDGDNWVYTVVLTGPPITSTNTNANISIAFPYVAPGIPFEATFSATHDGGIPVQGTPTTITGTT